jgi:hypothetical protein
VVTGGDGKCYGLNIGKLLRINMCDGVTAWGGDRQRGKAELRMQKVETQTGEGRQWAAREGACAPPAAVFLAYYRLLSLIIGYYPVVFGKADAV